MVRKRRREAPEPVQLTGGVACPERTVSLWRAGTLCDVEIRVGRQQFGAHRLVLASGSPMLEALLTSAMGDKSAPTLRDMEPPVFEAVLEWLYTGQCCPSEPELPAVLEAATRLQVDQLAEAATDAIIERIGPENAAAFWTNPTGAAHPRLTAAAKAALLNSFEAFATTQDFCSLSVDQLAELLADNSLPGPETAVFDAVCRWFEANSPDAETAERILSLIRFGLMDQETLAGLKHVPVLQALPNAGWVVATALSEALHHGRPHRVSKQGCPVQVTYPGGHYSNIFADGANADVARVLLGSCSGCWEGGWRPDGAEWGRGICEGQAVGCARVMNASSQFFGFLFAVRLPQYLTAENRARVVIMGRDALEPMGEDSKRLFLGMISSAPTCSLAS